MSYFKKFTDFAAGVAAFVAGLFLIREYMSFSEDELLLEEKSKLVQFIEYPGIDIKMYLYLIFFIALAITLGIIFKKLPYVGLLFAFPPFVLCFFMFGDSCFYEQSALYLTASILLVTGNLVECIWRDKDDGGHRLFVSSKICSAVGALTCVIIYLLAKNPPDKANKPFDTLNAFEREIYYITSTDELKYLLILAATFAAVLIIGLILYNVYFADALLSLLPLGFALYITIWEKLTIAPLVFVALAAVCTASNIMLALFENNLSRKEQKNHAEN